MSNGPVISENREAERIGTDLIARHHPDLCEARIRYLSTSAKPPKRKGCRQFGQVALLGPIPRYLSSSSGDMDDGDELVLVLREEVWQGFLPAQRRAALDHLLSHVAPEIDADGERTGWRIVGHTVEEFAAVHGRHGAWSSDLREFDAAGRQLALGLDADDSRGGVAAAWRHFREAGATVSEEDGAITLSVDAERFAAVMP